MDHAQWLPRLSRDPWFASLRPEMVDAMLSRAGQGLAGRRDALEVQTETERQRVRELEILGASSSP